MVKFIESNIISNVVIPFVQQAWNSTGASLAPLLIKGGLKGYT